MGESLLWFSLFLIEERRTSIEDFRIVLLGYLLRYKIVNRHSIFILVIGMIKCNKTIESSTPNKKGMSFP